MTWGQLVVSFFAGIWASVTRADKREEDRATSDRAVISDNLRRARTGS